MTAPPPTLARRLGLATGATLASLLLAELVLRALGIAPPRWAETRHLESDDKRLGLDLYPSDEADAFPLDLSEEAARAPLRARLPELDRWAARAPHGVLGHYSPELCRVAAEGEPLPPVDRARPRVVFVGDSFIEGQGVIFEHTAPRRVADALGDDVDVLACGRRGYDFAIDAATPGALEAWIGRHVLDADVVVYAMTLNDPARAPAFQAAQAYVDDWIVDRRRMLAEGGGQRPWWTPRLFALVEDRLEGLRIGRATAAWYRDMVGAPNEAGWRATREAIARLDATLRAEGRVLVVALWPLLVSLEAYPFDDVHHGIGEALSELGVRFVDTLPAFAGADARTLWVHEVDHHPDAEGHRRFADAIAEPLREALAAARDLGPP
jgi:lysophospholipase L1-like esterase